jgi:hypothetical protein
VVVVGGRAGSRENEHCGGGWQASAAAGHG